MRDAGQTAAAHVRRKLTGVIRLMGKTYWGITMLKAGDSAPAFSLPDQSGNLLSLADFISARALVLYFYPADFTPG